MGFGQKKAITKGNAPQSQNRARECKSCSQKSSRFVERQECYDSSTTIRGACGPNSFLKTATPGAGRARLPAVPMGIRAQLNGTTESRAPVAVPKRVSL